WDMNSGAEIKSIAAHGSGVTTVAFARDGRLVTGGRDHVVRIWKSDGAKLQDLDPFAEIVLHAQFANDDNAIIADDFTGEIRVASAADGKTVGAIDSNPPTIAQRLADLDLKLTQAQANSAKASTDLAAAQDAAKKAAAEVQPARIIQLDLASAITAFVGR